MFDLYVCVCVRVQTADCVYVCGFAGRRGRDTWQDIQMTLPKRPEPVEEPQWTGRVPNMHARTMLCIWLAILDTCPSHDYRSCFVMIGMCVYQCFAVVAKQEHDPWFFALVMCDVLIRLSMY